MCPIVVQYLGHYIHLLFKVHTCLLSFVNDLKVLSSCPLVHIGIFDVHYLNLASWIHCIFLCRYLQGMMGNKIHHSTIMQNQKSYVVFLKEDEYD